MALQYQLNPAGCLVLTQDETPPLVYLDHWALRTLSEDDARGDAFVQAILARGATLAISWVNIVEFSNMQSPDAHAAAERLVARIMPNVFCMESNPITVRQHEDEQLQGLRTTSPHADIDLMKVVGGLRPVGLEPVSTRGLFAAVHGSFGVGRNLEELADLILARIEALRKQFVDDPALRKSAHGVPPVGPHPRGTRQLFRELVTTLLVDPRLKLTRQHAIDLLHAVVPLAYCDYVLLDAHWEAQVSRVRRKLVRAGVRIPMAAVFSARRGGIDRFVRELGNGDA